MYFDDFNALLAMGGHAPYVWTAYGLGFLVLSWNLLSPVLTGRKISANIRRRARREKEVQESRS